MRTFIRKVFKILGIAMLSLILFNIVFGGVGRTFIWQVVHQSMENRWADVTLCDGRKSAACVDKVFTDAVEYNRGY